MTTLRSLLLLAILVPASGLRAQLYPPTGTVTLNVSAGLLARADGTVLNDGEALLQLLGSWGPGTSSPTASSFTGGSASQAVLWSGLLDSATTTGLTGAMVISLADLPIHSTVAGTGYLSEGVGLTLRWYPGLPLTATSPGSAFYGEYGFNQGLDAWRVPAAGSLINLDFITFSAGGVLDDDAGRARFAVGGSGGLTPVPEAAGFAWGALLICGVGAAWRWKRLAKAPMPRA